MLTRDEIIELIDSDKSMEEVLATLESRFATQPININAVNEAGDNILQQIISDYSSEMIGIMKLFIDKGIDISHRNNNGDTLIDKMLGTHSRRYYHLDALYDLCRLKPEVLTLPSRDGKILLYSLLRITPRRNHQNMEALIIKYRQHDPAAAASVMSALLENIMTEFQHGTLSLYHMHDMLPQLLVAKMDIDVERCLAIVMKMPHNIYTPTMRNSILAIRKPIAALVYEWIERITAPGDEREAAFAFAKTELIALKFQLDCFDEDVLEGEEIYLRKQSHQDEPDAMVMFGHVFSLDGKVPLSGKTVSLTGSTSLETGILMAQLMNAYVRHCEQTGMHTAYLNEIKQVRNMTVKSIRYYLTLHHQNQYYPFSKLTQTEVLNAMVADCQHTGVEIYTGWKGHAISLVIKGNTLVRANGGGCSTDATTEVYEMQKPEHLTVTKLKLMHDDDLKNRNKKFLQRDLHVLLDLKLTSSHQGKFQTVGNCSLESKRIALLSKYELFLPEEIANEIYRHTCEFFESYYLNDYLTRFKHSATTPHLLMRLILQRLLPENRLTLAASVLANFTNAAEIEIMQAEFMLARWKLTRKGRDTSKFDEALASLNITLEPSTPRLILLNNILTRNFMVEIIEVASWPEENLYFQGYHFLHLFVMNDQVSLANSLLHHFISKVDDKDWYDKRPLDHAQSAEMVDLLVRAGANIKDKRRNNALDCAVKAENMEVITALIKAGAVASKYTAYYAATRPLEILLMIIKHFPDKLDKRTHNRRRAIHAAAEAGLSENVQALVYYGGANPDKADVNGISPTELAVRRGYLDVARYLVASPLTLFRQPHRGDSAVAKLGDEKLKKQIEMMHAEREADRKYFLEKFLPSDPGVIVQEVDELILAIRCEDIAAIRGFFIACPKVSVVEVSKHYSDSPLANAILRMSRDTEQQRSLRMTTIKLLLQTPGININAKIASSEPLIFMATSMDDPEVLKLFLADPNLDINLQDSLQYTALHDAASRGHAECVKLLLADPRTRSDIQNDEGLTPAEVVKSDMDGDACKQLFIAHQLAQEAKQPRSPRK